MTETLVMNSLKNIIGSRIMLILILGGTFSIITLVNPNRQGFAKKKIINITNALNSSIINQIRGKLLAKFKNIIRLK
jgi:hypothetical protein